MEEGEFFEYIFETQKEWGEILNFNFLNLREKCIEILKEEEFFEYFYETRVIFETRKEWEELF